MDRKIKHRISPEYVLLGFLYRQPGYGYELHRKLESEFGYIWHISQSQIYNILKRLEAQKFITSIPTMQKKLPARQLLRLTDEGIQRFIEWLNASTNCSVHAIRVEFLTRLYFMQLYMPQNTFDIIHKQMDEVSHGAQILREIRENLPDDQRFNRLALEMRIKLLGSIQDWLEECYQEFSDPCE